MTDGRRSISTDFSKFTGISSSHPGLVDTVPDFAVRTRQRAEVGFVISSMPTNLELRKY
jgi:hypothetical protein